MSAFGEPIGGVRRRRLAAVALAAVVLAAFAACLNPHPDDNPLRRPSEPAAPVANQGNPGVSAPDEMGSSLLEVGDDGKQAPSGSPSPPSPTASEAPPAAGTTSSGSADAGAPPDAGDTGGLVEADAGD